MNGDAPYTWPDPPAHVRALVGQRVRLVDVPSARGTVLRAVSPATVLVRWDGARFQHVELVHRLERVS